MPTDIDLYSPGGLAPITPDQPLSPRADDWGIEPDYIGYDTTGELTFFGEPIQATEAQLEQLVGELAGGFQMQFSAAGYSQRHIQAAVAWFNSQWDSPPRQEQVRHQYSLPAIYASDPVAISFANHCAACNAPPAFVFNAINWLEKVGQQLNSQQVTASSPVSQPRTAPSSADPTDQLSNADYNRVLAANERAQAATMDYLENHWGRAQFRINLAIVEEHYSKLPSAHRKHFEQYTEGWVKFGNTKEAILGLFNEAIGSVPTSPAEINAEIEALEKIMREERRRWNSNESLGARYRQLLNMRGGR